MIKKLNEKIIELCEEMEPYEKYYTIDEFLDEFSSCETIELFSKQIYLTKKDEDNDNELIEFDSIYQLYQKLENNEYDDSYYVMEMITVYDQIDDITENVLEYIEEDFNYDEQIQIVKHVGKHYLNCYENNTELREDIEEYLNIIKSCDDEELFMIFNEDQDFAEIILEDYIQEIYEMYQDNIYDEYDEDIKTKTINNIIRDNINNIINSIISKVGNDTDSYKLIQMYLTLNTNNDERTFNFKKYAVLTLIYDYFIICSNQYNKNTLSDSNKIYYDYIRKNDDSSNLYNLFKNDDEFAICVIYEFVKNEYIDKIYYNKFNKMDKEDIKVLKKNFLPIAIIDAFDNR